MKKLILSSLLLSSIIFADTFTISVGSKIDFNIHNFKKAKITIYKDNSFIKTTSEDINNYILILNSLTLYSDSINSPEAFEIKTKNEKLRCVRINKEEDIVKNQSCAILIATDKSTIEYKRRYATLMCTRTSN